MKKIFRVVLLCAISFANVACASKSDRLINNFEKAVRSGDTDDILETFVEIRNYGVDNFTPAQQRRIKALMYESGYY